MIRQVIVVGSGTAGLIAALTLKRRSPQLDIQILRDPDIGVIGVGEGTTPNVHQHLLGGLGIKHRDLYERAAPTWKLGIRFLWGPRKDFFYSFVDDLNGIRPGMKMPVGYYCDEEFTNLSPPMALMGQGYAFQRDAGQMPDLQPWFALHIENHKLVGLLEEVAVERGIRITDGKVTEVVRGEKGITALRLADGQCKEADFFIDASGFKSELLGGALEEPFQSFGKTLFCDRAVVGGWERTDEEILPYTTAEAMDHGWCWRIEHENVINRGYVYSSDMVSDDEAFEEFTRKNPKVPDDPRIVPFRSGCYRRLWVDNVVAVGNAGGFVEPLEATAMMAIVFQCQLLSDLLHDSVYEPTDSIRKLYNTRTSGTWEEIRDFLGLHYVRHTPGETPYWRRCQNETDLSGIADLLEFYEQNGPSRYCQNLLPTSMSSFGIEGYLVMLVGTQAPYTNRYEPTKHELKAFREHRSFLEKRARKGIGVKEALGSIRSPRWKWMDEK